MVVAPSTIDDGLEVVRVAAQKIWTLVNKPGSNFTGNCLGFVFLCRYVRGFATAGIWTRIVHRRFWPLVGSPFDPGMVVIRHDVIVFETGAHAVGDCRVLTSSWAGRFPVKC
jgi:hypothetical protein